MKLVQQVQESYESWNHYHERGGTDPTWTDGCNMNLIRNHILFDKRQIEEICAENNMDLPDAYFRPMPDRVPDGYMARTEEIMEHARASLACYEEDVNYKYLLENGRKVDDKTKEKIYLNTVCNFVSNLRIAIEENDFVFMRRHENPDRYIRSFRECADKLRAILAQDDPLSDDNNHRNILPGQMKLFDNFFQIMQK